MCCVIRAIRQLRRRRRNSEKQWWNDDYQRKAEKVRKRTYYSSQESQWTAAEARAGLTSVSAPDTFISQLRLQLNISDEIIEISK
jgi:hypothetical protein